MKKIKLLYLCLFVVGSLCLSGQIIPVRDGKILHSTQLELNEFGEIFILNDQVINKLNGNGLFVTNFGDRKMGKIHSIDVSNPFKILVFYQDFQSIVILDRNLKQQKSPINLKDVGIEFAQEIAWSNDDSFWVFDAYQKICFNISSNLMVKKKTPSFSNLLPEKSELYKIQEESGILYCFFSDFGAVLFDNLGNFYKTISLKDYDWIQALNRKAIIYYGAQDRGITFLDILSAQTKYIGIGASKKFDDCFYSRESLYMLVSDTIFVESLNK